MPLPAGIQLMAVARFLESLSLPGGPDPYLAELSERLPAVRSPGDVMGIDPAGLDRALAIVLRSIRSVPVLAETAGVPCSTFARGLALSFWMAGEHSRALRALGIGPKTDSAGIDRLIPPGSAEALRQAARLLSAQGMKGQQELEGLAAWLETWRRPGALAVPVVQYVPEGQAVGETPRGILRAISLGAMEWKDGPGDEADANTALAEFDGDWGTFVAIPLQAARALLDEYGLRVPRRALRLQLVFDRPGAFHEGSSANLALAALFFCRVLRLAEARDEYTLRPGLALTGVLAGDGAVLPVEPRQLSAKVAAAFFSPIQQLVVPSAQLEQARDTLGALRSRYPHRTLGLRGIEHLREVYCDRRLTEHRRITVVRRIGRSAWKLRRPIAAAVLMMLLALVAARWYGPLDREPALVEFRGELLVLQNATGQDLRTISVGRRTVEHAEGLASGEIQREIVNLRDVDGDGDLEVLFIVHPPDGSRNPQTLVCQGSSEDSPRWTFPGRFALRFPNRTEMASDAFRLEEIWTGDCDGDGRMEVILLANHVFFPSVIARLDAATGTLEEQYVHVGTLGDMAVLDLDADGIPEILACGTNNALNMACLVVLDPRALRGHSPTDTAYMIDGMTRARERSYLLFPRTPVGEAFADRYERNGAVSLEIEPDARMICVRVQDAGGNALFDSVTLDPLLYYYFTFDLRALRVAASNEFDTVGRLLWQAGRRAALPGKEFLEAARRNIRYLVRAPAMSSTPRPE